MDRSSLIRRIDVAAGREPADLVIQNGKIIDVFNGEIAEGDVAIVDGIIAGIGGRFEGKKIVDAGGRYLSPAFIDGHVHIESSLVTPAEFAKALLIHGVTAVIADPHEIANVLGTKGIQYMLDSSQNLPFDFYFMLPSCVPATPFEHAGAVLEAEDLKPFYSHPRVLGLAEVMNYPAVLHAEEAMLDKILDAERLDKKIDGHAAGLSSEDVNVYMSAGIRTDHESTTAVEVKERLKRGMYVMLREGTIAKDLRQLLPAVNERNARRCLFVTDDKHLDDLLSEGSIDHNVRLAICSGIPPITAIQMATINAAECFGLKTKGAIAPGYKADFILLDNLEEIVISEVYKDGQLIASNGALQIDIQTRSPVGIDHLKQSVQTHKLTEDHFTIPLSSDTANVIGVIPNSLLTHHLIEKVNRCDKGFFQSSTTTDQLKLAVIERHQMTGQIGLGIVKGLELQSGAIATTIAHDSHNLVIAGTNNHDMLLAAAGIREMQGGLIVVNNGKILAKLALPIAGLMTDLPYQEVYRQLQTIHLALQELGVSHAFNPFLTLSFLTLPVIPELKLTDNGLFQVSKFQHIDLNNVIIPSS